MQQMRYAKWNKADAKDYKLYDAIYIMVWKSQNWDRKQCGIFQVVSAGMILTTKGHERTFLGNGNFLYIDCRGGGMAEGIYCV